MRRSPIFFLRHLLKKCMENCADRLAHGVGVQNRFDSLRQEMILRQTWRTKNFYAAVVKTHTGFGISAFVVQNARIVDHNVAFPNGVIVPADLNVRLATAYVLQLQKIRVRVQCRRNNRFLGIGATDVKQFWKRIIEIAVNMGVLVINTEFSGDPNQQEICNGMFFRSMEELFPIIEREGLRVEIQSHPYDFCELNDEICDIVKSFRSKNLGCVYSASHGFFYDQGKGDVRHMLRYAGDDLTHVLLADTWNQTIDCRYIVNPPWLNGHGRGDNIICVSYFGFPEKMDKQAPEALDRIKRELLSK